MKYSVVTILFIVFVSVSFGQIPTQSPSPNKTKIFGSSLEKYKNKEKKDSQPDSKNNPSNTEEIIQFKTDLIITNVLVTDKNGNIITGLNKNDFIVIEDNVPQTIEMFAFGERLSPPRSIVLIIDTGIAQLPYLKNSIQAAKVLIDKLKSSDKMAIITDHLRLLANFTQDKNLLKETLDSIEVKYKDISVGFEFTNLLAVLNEMFSKEDYHRIIISQGSGNGIFRVKTDDETLQQTYKSFFERRGVKRDWAKDFEFDDLVETIDKSNTTIYSIIPGIRVLGLPKKEQYSRAQKDFENIYKSFHLLVNDSKEIRSIPPNLYSIPPKLLDFELIRLTKTQESMFKVAELSGGYTSFLETPEQAENIYDNIFNDFSNRYSIGYYLTNQEQDGKRRAVKIEVRNHPEYTVLYRESYLQK